MERVFKNASVVFLFYSICLQLSFNENLKQKKSKTGEDIYAVTEKF